MFFSFLAVFPLPESYQNDPKFRFNTLLGSDTQKSSKKVENTTIGWSRCETVFGHPPAKADIATAILTNVIEHLVLLLPPNKHAFTAKAVWADLMVECRAQVPTFDLQGASTAAFSGSCISRGARGDTKRLTRVGFAKWLTGSYQQNCQLLVSIGFAVVHHSVFRGPSLIIPEHVQWIQWKAPEADQGPTVQRQDHKVAQLNLLTAAEVATTVVSLVRLYPRWGIRLPVKIVFTRFNHSVLRHEAEKEQDTNRPLKSLKHEWCRNLFSEAGYIGIRPRPWWWWVAGVIWFSSVSSCCAKCFTLSSQVRRKHHHHHVPLPAGHRAPDSRAKSRGVLAPAHLLPNHGQPPERLAPGRKAGKTRCRDIFW